MIRKHKFVRLGENMFSLDKVLAALSTIALGVAGAPAIGAVITFEELPHLQELEGVGNVVYSKGYQLTYLAAPDEPYPVGFFSVGPSWRFNGRSTALLANSCGAVTTLVSQDNNPLTLESIDLAELNGDSDVSVAFTGITNSGSTVQKVVSLRNRTKWQRVEFPPSFKNLRSVSWIQGDCVSNFPHMFDNIRVFPTWRGRNED